jgi:hypothetical protein
MQLIVHIFINQASIAFLNHIQIEICEHVIKYTQEQRKTRNKNKIAAISSDNEKQGPE